MTSSTRLSLGRTQDGHSKSITPHTITATNAVDLSKLQNKGKHSSGDGPFDMTPSKQHLAFVPRGTMEEITDFKTIDWEEEPKEAVNGVELNYI